VCAAQKTCRTLLWLGGENLLKKIVSQILRLFGLFVNLFQEVGG
jgi:hypothetical protein